MDDLTDDEVEAVSQAMGDEVKEDVRDPAEAPAAPNSPSAPKDGTSNSAATGSISRAQFMQLEEVAVAADVPPADLKRMQDVKVKVEVVLGQTKMPLEDVLKIHPGSVVELNKLAGEPVEILANGQLIARAEVVVIDETFGVKILEIVGTKQKLGVVS